jgi:hypothetical protein
MAVETRPAREFILRRAQPHSYTQRPRDNVVSFILLRLYGRLDTRRRCVAKPVDGSVPDETPYQLLSVSGLASPHDTGAVMTESTLVLVLVLVLLKS